MDEKEHKAQKALGNSKPFRVVVNVPLKAVGSVIYEVDAVNETHAVEQAQKILNIESTESILRKVASSTSFAIELDENEVAEFDASELLGLDARGENNKVRTYSRFRLVRENPGSGLAKAPCDQTNGR